MSLVPYAPHQERQIVLRHHSAVVVYDKQSRQLSVRSDAPDTRTDHSKCPTCNRAYREQSPHAPEDGTNLPASTTFMDRGYFRMLQHALPASGNTSRTSSPRPIDGPNLSRDPSAILHSPPGTEFIASEPIAGQGISKKAFSPNYFKTFFKEVRELGRGGKGVVLLVTHVIDSVELGEFACKRVPVGDDHAWLEKVLIEVQTLQDLSHPNLVSYRHVWLEDFQISNFGPMVPCAFILQQFCNSGDLHHYVLGDHKTTLTPMEMKERMRRKSRATADDDEDILRPKRLGFDEIYSFFKDITSGLHHLHSHGFIHRDLKPQNCLLNQINGRLQVLLSDFGEVQVSTLERIGTGATGTVSYCAPEVLRRSSPRNRFGNFSVKSDVFSVGMIVHFMAFGGLPYVYADNVNEENEDVEKLRAEIVAWPGFDEDQRRGRNDLPDMLYKFLKRLLAIDPHERLTTEEILRNIRSAAQDHDFNYTEPPLASSSERRPSRISEVNSPSPHARSHFRRHSSSQLPVLRPSKLSQQVDSTMTKRSPERRRRNVTISDEDQEDDLSYDSSSSIPENAIIAKADGISRHDYAPQPPERLALPAPPTPVFHTLMSVFGPVLRISLLVIKYWSITTPCSPMSTNPLIAYPLLLLAALDLLPSPQNTSQLTWTRGAILAAIHVLIVAWSRRANILCEGMLPAG